MTAPIPPQTLATYGKRIVFNTGINPRNTEEYTIQDIIAESYWPRAKQYKYGSYEQWEMDP